MNTQIETFNYRAVPVPQSVQQYSRGACNFRINDTRAVLLDSLAKAVKFSKQVPRTSESYALSRNPALSKSNLHDNYFQRCSDGIPFPLFLFVNCSFYKQVNKTREYTMFFCRIILNIIIVF